VNGTAEPDAGEACRLFRRSAARLCLGLGSIAAGAPSRGFSPHRHGNLEVTAFGPREVIAQDDKAAPFGWFRLHFLSTQRNADIPYAIYVELRDGLIRKYHFLENTFDVAAAFRAGGSWSMSTDGTACTAPPSNP
jgi:hypothetical protein